MKPVQRLLLVPCLAPLLALLVIAGFNSRSSSRLQVLTWRSSPQPIGVWMALAGLSGAGLSGVAALLLLPPAPRLSRRLHQPLQSNRATVDQDNAASWAPDPMPERDVRDPSPTVAVPFRVIQRGTAPSSAPSAGSDQASARRPNPQPSPATEPMDWGDDPDQDW